MPDYLARVVAAGMRTSIEAKPPVSGPPLLPGHRSSYSAFALPMTNVGQVEGQGVQGDVSTERVVPALPAEAVAVKKQVPLTTDVEQVEGQGVHDDVSTERVVPALPATTVTVDKQVPLKFVGSTQLRQQAPPIATPTIRAPKALRPANASGSVPSQVSQEVIRSDMRATPNSLVEVDTAMSSPAAPLLVAPSVREPIDKRPTISNLSLPRGPVEGNDTQSMTTLNPWIQPGVSHAPDRVTKDREQGVLPSQGSLKQVGTPPMPPAQASAPLMPPTNNPTSRQVKLTIGQLDVQVHNRLPAPPAKQSPSTVSNAVTDALEQRYLDRFRLKP